MTSFNRTDYERVLQIARRLDKIGLEPVRSSTRLPQLNNKNELRKIARELYNMVTQVLGQQEPL